MLIKRDEMMSRIKLLISLYLLIKCHCFQSNFKQSGTSKVNFDLKSVSISRSNILPPSNTVSIKEDAAQSILQNLNCANILIDSTISTTSLIPTSFANFKQSNNIDKQTIPIVLIHGFDSSCLEFRRLAPLLSKYTEVFVPDVLGWGFGDYKDVIDFSPNAKMKHLKCFIEQVVGRPCIVIGASLGGAVAINLASEICPELVKKVVLIDAQGFIDGKGKANLPDFVAKFVVGILKSAPLRMFANYLSYKDKSFATYDAMLVGSAHCTTDSWDRASVNFLLSGGFLVSDNVKRVKQETLVLWGRNDEILDIDFVRRFQSTLPSNTIYMVEDCGHVPHLEKPQEIAAVIEQFIA